MNSPYCIAYRILVENLLGKLMFGKVSSRWVKNVTVDFSMELTHDTIL